MNGLILWFTGLSGAGKTTLSDRVGEILQDKGYKVQSLDGDVIRNIISPDLGFSKEDRNEQVRRTAYIAEEFARHGIIVLVSLISPYREIREEVKNNSDSNFIEVYVHCPLRVCERRDPKGLYKRARAGELKSFTGIDDPYEEPDNPDITCYTDIESEEQNANKIMSFLESRIIQSMESGFIAGGGI